MAEAVADVDGEAGPAPDRTSGPAPRRATLPDVAFALLAAGTAALHLVWSSSYLFFADDWRLLERGGGLGDLFRPYNGHLGPVLVGTYQVLYDTVGLRSTLPLRVVGVLAATALAVAVHWAVRRRLGPAAALVVGAVVLWYPGTVVQPAQLNFHLPLAAVVLCSVALRSDAPRHDWVVAGLLAFAVLCSGVGVAGAVGALGGVVLGPARWRRRLAVAAPLAAWLAWWVPADTGSGARSSSWGDRVAFAAEGLLGSFSGLALGSTVLGVALLVAWVVVLARHLRGGLRAAAPALGWCGGLAFWWASLAYSRAHLDDPGAYRYRLAGSVMVLLAALAAVRGPSLRRWAATTRWAGPAAVAVALLVVLLGWGDVADEADRWEGRHDRLRAQLAVVAQGPEAVPDDVVIRLGGFMRLPAGRYRQLTDRFGDPPGTTPEDVDRAVVDLEGVGLRSSSAEGSCAALGAAPLHVAGPIVLRSEGGAVPVEVRRFGDRWVEVGTVDGDGPRALELPPLGSPVRWEVRAEGACRVADPPEVAVRAPVAGDAVDGTVRVAVSAAAPVEVERVQVVLRRDGEADEPLGDAVRLFGWVLEWDAGSVPEGAYELVAVATTEDGVRGTSEPVAVTVRR